MPSTSPLLTDLYELNMAASYLRRHMTGTATFSLFVRRLPAERGFLVAAGVEDCLDLLEAFSFDERDLAYLATLGFDAASIESFSRTRLRISAAAFLVKVMATISSGFSTVSRSLR